MEAEDRRRSGFSREKAPGESGFSPRGENNKSFRSSEKPHGLRTGRPEKGGFSRSGEGRSGFKKDYSGESHKPLSAGRGRKPEGQAGERRKPSAEAGARFSSPRGERGSAGQGAPKRVSPAKNRLGTQAPEQAKEFRRRGNSMPDYDEQKLASMAGGRGRKPVGRKAKEKEKDKKNDEQLVRLNRFIAQSGLCSRREADDLISTGQITVNGKVMDQMGYLVQPGDVVKYGRRLLNKEKLVYVLLNKPKDFLTTTEDPEERKTVMALVENACKERIYPVGRLDRNTTGLLLITNDGELSERL
ncbi:MAG: pseudouridine synthase, partial [Flavobacteriales bacterium]